MQELYCFVHKYVQNFTVWSIKTICNVQNTVVIQKMCIAFNALSQGGVSTLM